jgi:hypothetical protein
MIKGRVARILSEFQLVLNVGSAQGVEPDMRFVVFEEGDEVIDPETGGSLGRLELVKGEVIVTHAQEGMSIVTSQRRDNESDHSVLSERLQEITTYSDKRLSKEHQRLNIVKGEISGSPSLGPIRVGDSVRSVG